jgi:threonine aldolase
VELALKIRAALEEKGIALYYDSPTNQQFPILTDGQMRKLSEKYSFSVWAHLEGGMTAVRFCTSWATRPEDVDELIADIQNL